MGLFNLPYDGQLSLWESVADVAKWANVLWAESASLIFSFEAEWRDYYPS